jgi:hypothetical protein
MMLNLSHAHETRTRSGLNGRDPQRVPGETFLAAEAAGRKDPDHSFLPSSDTTVAFTLPDST